jgi:hypothetical protein
MLELRLELATASGVITSAAATVATSPARSEAKAFVSFSFHFLYPCFRGFVVVYPFCEGYPQHLCHLANTWSHI